MEKLIELLKREVVPARGCTEPVAVAYAVAYCTSLLGKTPDKTELFLSANVIKNAMGVGIPGTGERGLDIAIALGAVIAKPEKELEILCEFTKDELSLAREFIKEEKIKINLAKDTEPLYIEAKAYLGDKCAHVIIAGKHTNIVFASCENVLIDKHYQKEQKSALTQDVSLKKIYEFATCVNTDDIKFLLDGAKMNREVAKEGIEHDYGLQTGKKLYSNCEANLLMNSISNRIISVTAAASDARMGGCEMTIMTVGGSGNQGISSLLPAYELGLILDKSEEEITRALAISVLVTLHMKNYMGRLSPLCGAGIAGTTGSGCAMVYLLGGKYENIAHLINNMLSDVSGMLCDGAKSTCALKIATGLAASIECVTLAMNGISPTSKDGIVFDDADETIRNLQNIVRYGLCTMDETILNIMLGK